MTTATTEGENIVNDKCIHVSGEKKLPPEHLNVCTKCNVITCSTCLMEYHEDHWKTKRIPLKNYFENETASITCEIDENNKYLSGNIYYAIEQQNKKTTEKVQSFFNDQLSILDNNVSKLLEIKNHLMHIKSKLLIAPKNIIKSYEGNLKENLICMEKGRIYLYKFYN
jgi:hypothetical protein